MSERPSRPTWLLTGGAGYIGAHVARALRAAGLGVVVLDDLSSGVAARLDPDVPLVRASVLDTDAVADVVREHGVTGVVHLAAKKAAGESVARPLHYWRENIGGFESLLRAMAETSVEQIVLSSSAATFGSPETPEVSEESPTRPINPYGETKLVCEWLLRDVAAISGLRWAALRYFNVAGAGSPELGDTSVTNLVPLALGALADGRAPKIFGTDYDTPDGTCVRDYIHVSDLADAHVAAAERLSAGPLGEVYNIGRGEGASVREVIDMAREVSGVDVAPEVVARRAGDPARLVGRVDKVRDQLSWSASRDLRDMVASAWAAGGGRAS